MIAEDRLVSPQSFFFIFWYDSSDQLLWVKYSLIVCINRAFPPLYISLTRLILPWCKCNGSKPRCETLWYVSADIALLQNADCPSKDTIKWSKNNFKGSWNVFSRIQSFFSLCLLCCPGPRHGGIMRKMTSPISQSWGSLASLKLSRFQLLCADLWTNKNCGFQTEVGVQLWQEK